MTSTSSADHVRHRIPRGMLVLFALAAACSSPSDPTDGASLTTDRDSYVAVSLNDPGTVMQYGFTVITQVRNTSMVPLYFETCGTSPIILFDVELVDHDGPAGSAYNSVWSCPAGDVKALAPGHERTDTLQLRGPTRFDSAQEPSIPLGKLEGRMRVIFPARTCPSQAACTWDAAAVSVLLRSNTFAVSVLSTQ